MYDVSEPPWTNKRCAPSQQVVTLLDECARCGEALAGYVAVAAQCVRHAFVCVRLCVHASAPLAVEFPSGSVYVRMIASVCVCVCLNPSNVAV